MTIKTSRTGQAGPLTWTASCQDRDFLERFYPHLDEAFPLADEKETLAGYRRIWTFLESQEGQRRAAQWGGVEEWVLLLEHDGLVVGGTNLCAIGGRAAGAMSVHGSFWFFGKEWQGRGWSKWLFGAIEQLLGRPFGADLVLFYEMNDPLGMDGDKLAEDYQQTGLHPVERMAISCAWGDRLLDLDYHQPALGPDQDDEAGLCLWVRGLTKVPVDLARRHLEAFLVCSVFKGHDPGELREHLGPLAQLEPGSALETLDVSPHLTPLRQACDTHMNARLTSDGGVRRWLHQRQAT